MRDESTTCVPEIESTKTGIGHLLQGERVIMQARGIRKAFGGNHVLKDVSFDLKTGEVILLRGDNGSGKTTLLNILTGNMEPDGGAILLDADGTREEFRFPRSWWRDLNPFDHFTPERVANEAVGRTWQDVRLFSTQTLIDNISVACPNQPGENPFCAAFLRRHTRHTELTNREESATLLDKLGMADRTDSSADKLSLGQTKRIAIARAVRAGARILFLDEPLAGLDADGVEDVMAVLSDLASNAKVTLVIIEHVFNISRVLELAHIVWTLHEGKVRIDTPDAVRAEMRPHTDQSTMSSISSMMEPNAAIISENIVGGAVLTRIRNPQTDVKEPTPVLELRDVVVRRGQRVVIGREASDGSLIGLNLIIYTGDMAILQAPNGWGKTTLLEAIAGIVPIERGEILLRGVPIQLLSPWKRIALGLNLLQSSKHTFDNLTVAETIALSGSPLRNEIIESMRVLPTQKMSSLSGGERQYLAFCILRRDILAIMDEPFSSLDINFIGRIQATGWTSQWSASLQLIPAECPVKVTT